MSYKLIIVNISNSNNYSYNNRYSNIGGMGGLQLIPMLSHSIFIPNPPRR